MDPMLADLPLSQDDEFDALAHSALARKVATLFEKRSGPPSNIAIYGPWGSGKSSVLYLLRKQLAAALGEGGPNWVEVDAWAFQSDDALIFKILAELYERAREPIKTSLLRIAMASALSVADLGLKLVTDKHLSLDDVEKNLKRAEKTVALESKHLLLREEFARVVKCVRANHADRHLLIVVDNLDRCRPDVAIRVLETLFLVGNTRDCTFLITVDQGVLISFLNRQYQATNFNGARYLEKVFPYAFRIPDPWVYWNYGQALLYTVVPAKPAEPDQVYLLLDRLLAGSAWDDRKEASKNDEEEDSVFATVWHYLSQSRILRNPRRIKRVVRYIRAYEPDDQPDAEKVLFLVILADLWPDAFEFLLSTNGATWQQWIDHLALPASYPAPDGTSDLEDQSLRDLVHQVFKFYDPKGKKIDNFRECPIRIQEYLLMHLKYLRELGL